MLLSFLGASVSPSIKRDTQAGSVLNLLPARPSLETMDSPSLFRDCFGTREKQAAGSSRLLAHKVGL